ncbi:YoaK family protein [Bordetella avium]|uniref:YoaK family protein n=1 Tax=Bordetella avium TaxID=521 RepID=UPI000FD9FC7E|nr:YoaK family protein [Bordetella avium]AZY53217.1 hypothetical protein C0J07_12505 [Bordetella avium]
MDTHLRCTSSLPLPLVLLCLASGYIDALGYAYHGVFAANMTGNTVLVGMSLAQHQWTTAVSGLSTLVLFFLGALAGGCFTPQRQWSYQLPLFTECALLVAASCLDPASSLWLALTATAMGLQASVIVGVGGSTVSTVVLTSTLAKLARLSARALFLAPFFGASSTPNGSRLPLLMAWSAYFLGAVAAGLLLTADWAMWAGTAAVAVLPLQQWRYRG